jgi:hypothetical protein
LPLPPGTLPNVSFLRREEFDAIEFEAAGSGDHETAARRMIKLAQTGTQTESMPRSEAFLRAGEQWLLADDPAAAEQGLRLAIADGGPVFVDPRVPLARALFLMERSAEAQSLLDELKAEGPRDPRICDLVAELLVERSDLRGALDWATAGVEISLQRQAIPADGRDQPDAVPADDEPAGATGNSESGSTTGGPASGHPMSGRGLTGEPGSDEAAAELRLLLSLRYRIRNDLGLPEDSYDALLDDA